MMKYYKKVTCGFVRWVARSEEPVKGAIEISEDEYEYLISDGLEDVDSFND